MRIFIIFLFWPVVKFSDFSKFHRNAPNLVNFQRLCFLSNVKIVVLIPKILHAKNKEDSLEKKKKVGAKC
jgi:hypothetical protein